MRTVHDVLRSFFSWITATSSLGEGSPMQDDTEQMTPARLLLILGLGLTTWGALGLALAGCATLLLGCCVLLLVLGTAVFLL